MIILYIGRHKRDGYTGSCRIISERFHQPAPDTTTLIRGRNSEVVDEELASLTASHRQDMRRDAADRPPILERHQRPKVVACQQSANVLTTQRTFAFVKNLSHQSKRRLREIEIGCTESLESDHKIGFGSGIFAHTPFYIAALERRGLAASVQQANHAIERPFVELVLLLHCSKGTCRAHECLAGFIRRPYRRSPLQQERIAIGRWLAAIGLHGVAPG